MPTQKKLLYRIGSRDESGAKGLWDFLAPVYRQYAYGLTDF